MRETISSFKKAFHVAPYAVAYANSASRHLEITDAVHIRRSTRLSGFEAGEAVDAAHMRSKRPASGVTAFEIRPDRLQTLKFKKPCSLVARELKLLSVLWLETLDCSLVSPKN